MKLFKTSYANHTDEQLMILIAQRDQKAFGQLYDRYARKLTWFCQRMVQSKEQAEDLVHEVFIKIMEQPKAFDSQQKFSTWVYTIANHLCLNNIRNQQNRERLLEKHYQPNQTVLSEHQLDAKQLKNKINELYQYFSDKEKAIFVMRFEHELPVKEIADILNIPEGSVKSCIFYLLKKCNTHLQPYTANQ